MHHIFVGGRWEFVHLDDIQPARPDCPSINSLRNMRISSIFDESEEGFSSDDISPELLIESCLLKAASLITDGPHRADRTTERIEILRSVVGTCSQCNLIDCKTKFCLQAINSLYTKMKRIVG